MRLFIFSITLTIIVSCQPYKVRKINGIDLSSIQADTTFKLRSDGLYNCIDTLVYDDIPKEKFERSTPLTVLNIQKAILGSQRRFNDIHFHLEGYNKFPRFTDYVGDYVIHNDTIWAKLPIVFNGRGGMVILYESYFQGEIKNRDTIVNWRMIRPFPKVNRDWNAEVLDQLQKPHQLYFIESKELEGLDSLYQQRLKEKEEMLKQKNKQK